MLGDFEALLDDAEADLLADARGDERLVVLAVLDDLRRRLEAWDDRAIDLRERARVRETT